jgi:hypothetical protein
VRHLGHVRGGVRRAGGEIRRLALLVADQGLEASGAGETLADRGALLGKLVLTARQRLDFVTPRSRPIRRLRQVLIPLLHEPQRPHRGHRGSLEDRAWRCGGRWGRGRRDDRHRRAPCLRTPGFQIAGQLTVGAPHLTIDRLIRPVLALGFLRGHDRFNMGFPLLCHTCPFSRLFPRPVDLHLLEDFVLQDGRATPRHVSLSQ